jgi:hypothetical protein
VADEQKNYGSKSLIYKPKAKSRFTNKKAAFRQLGTKTKAGCISASGDKLSPYLLV